jgi:hypothetical protein
MANTRTLEYQPPRRTTTRPLAARHGISHAPKRVHFIPDPAPRRCLRSNNTQSAPAARAENIGKIDQIFENYKSSTAQQPALSAEQRRIRALEIEIAALKKEQREWRIQRSRLEGRNAYLSKELKEWTRVRVEEGEEVVKGVCLITLRKRRVK